MKVSCPEKLGGQESVAAETKLAGQFRGALAQDKQDMQSPKKHLQHT